MMALFVFFLTDIILKERKKYLQQSERSRHLLADSQNIKHLVFSE